MLRKLSLGLIVSFCVLMIPGMIHAQSWSLFGISGKQQEDQVSPGVYTHKDHTLFQINTTNALLTQKIRMTWVPDSDAIGYCSKNGLLYHTAADGAYRNSMSNAVHDQDPSVETPCGACQDDQYMENYDLLTGTLTGVYNANPCPNPDNPTNDIGGDGLFMPCFGLPAPRPTWLEPQYRRDSTMVDYGGPYTNNITGPNEPSGIRGIAWSTELNSWYVSDGSVYKMSHDGMTCTNLGSPTFIIPTDVPSTYETNSDLKALAFIKVGGQTKLFGTYRNDSDTTGNTNGWIIEVDPATGQSLGLANQIGVHYPPGGSLHGTDQAFGGLLGLAQNPQTGEVYGIRKTDDVYARELVTIDLATGNSTLVGILTDGAYGQAITTLAFVPDILITSITPTGGGTTLTINWTGAAAPPFSLQSTASLTPPITWTTNATGLTGPSTTTSITNNFMFFRISKS